MTKKNMEMLVGLFVVLGIAALVFIALKAANLGSFGNNGGYMLQARFDNIGSLKPRAPVRSAGVHVGRVTGIRLDPKTYQGLVTIDRKSVVKGMRVRRGRARSAHTEST